MSITIKDFSVLDGGLPPRVMGLVIEWTSLHRDELMADWERARDNKPLAEIKPLE